MNFLNERYGQVRLLLILNSYKPHTLNTTTNQRDIDPVIKIIDHSDKYKQPELVSPTSTALLLLRASITFSSSFLTIQTKLLVMLAINKTTAAKLIVLWNLPALLLLAGAYEVGTTVFS